MSKGKRVSPNALCPFYKFETKYMVYCDSFSFDDESTLHLAFATPTSCKSWKNVMCKDRFLECPLYQLLEEMEK